MIWSWTLFILLTFIFLTFKKFEKLHGWSKIDFYTCRGFYLDDRWKLPSSISPRVDYFFYRFFLLSNFTGEQRFLLCLRSSDGKFLNFDHYPCILECCLSFSLLFRECVCVGGGVSRSVINFLSLCFYLLLKINKAIFIKTSWGIR